MAFSPIQRSNSISTKTFLSSVTYLMLLSQLPRFAQGRPNGAGNVKCFGSLSAAKQTLSKPHSASSIYEYTP
jgi:hypothetical protein